MVTIFRRINEVARGEILSLNPNLTSATKRSANLGMTMLGALREVCPWSRPYEEKKLDESAARSNINGRVKMFVKGTIIKDFEDEDLNRILLEACKAYINADLTSIEEIKADSAVETFLIQMSPLVLKYVHAKVKLLEKHILAPNFSNYDMRLVFGEGRLDVKIEGYVYAKQFSQVNQQIAENPQLRLLPDVVGQVLHQVKTLPTTTLDWRVLSNQYEINEMRAKTIIHLALEHQVAGSVSPLSLLDLWTPGEWSPSDEEQRLKARIIQLSQEESDYESVEESIVAIVQALVDEGLTEELVTEHIDPDILRQVKDRLTELYPQLHPSLNYLMWYHIILLKTGGSNQWTARRTFGETQIIPYHPLLLEALKTTVEVRVDLTDKNLNPTFGVQPEDQVMVGPDWTEVTILKFLHGLSHRNSDDLSTQPVVPVIAVQDHVRSFKEAVEQDEEIDDVFMNRKNEGFIIINGDLRKLYSKRPAALQQMTFAQFVICFYRLQTGQQCVLDPQTNIGGESAESIVGGDSRVPLCFRLSNNVIMKRRSEKKRPIPLLLKSNTLDIYGERLMFQPWRSLDDLLQEDSEEEAIQRKQNRLSLFPMSVFPSPTDRY